MTLSATPTPAQIVAELRQTFPYTFPDARTRWLADLSTSAAIVFPTSFANKQAVKLVDSALGTLGTTHSINLSFGAAFTGRRLVYIIFWVGKQAGAVGGGSHFCTGITLAGVADANLGMWSFAGTNASTIMSAVAIGSLNLATGTSGNLNFTTSIAVTPYVVLLSTSNVENTDGTGGFGGAVTTLGMSTTAPTNGVCIAAVIRNDTTNITWTGLTERSEVTQGAYRLGVAWDNRLTAGAKNVSWSSAASASANANAIASYG